MTNINIDTIELCCRIRHLCATAAAEAAATEVTAHERWNAFLLLLLLRQMKK